MAATQSTDLTPFSIDVEPRRDVVRVCPRGELDMATVDAVREQVDELLAAGFSRLVLDLRDVTFMDSTGLRLVIELARSSEGDGWKLALVDGPAAVRRVFDATALRARLPFVEAPDGQISSWSSTWR